MFGCVPDAECFYVRILICCLAVFLLTRGHDAVFTGPLRHICSPANAGIIRRHNVSLIIIHQSFLNPRLWILRDVPVEQPGRPSAASKLSWSQLTVSSQVRAAEATAAKHRRNHKPACWFHIGMNVHCGSEGLVLLCIKITARETHT